MIISKKEFDKSIKYKVNKMSIKKYIITALITGMFAGGIYLASRNPVRIIPVGIWPNNKNPESVNITNPDNKNLSYIDKKPFGSLDYVIDYTSGKRIERQPTGEDINVFGRLESIARDRGLIPPSCFR